MSLLSTNRIASSEMSVSKLSQPRMPLQPRNINTVRTVSSEDGTKMVLTSGDAVSEKNRVRFVSNLSLRKTSSSNKLSSQYGNDNGPSASNPASNEHETRTYGRSKVAKEEHRRPAGQSMRGRENDEDVVIEEKRKRINGDGYTLHKYLRGRLLGKGGFARVYLCTALDTNKQYAVKVVPKANLVKTRARQKLQAEIKIHRTLKHKNICEYKHFFEDRNNCYILLELCHNQSMNELIKRRKRLTEQEAALFLNQLVEAVDYMHKNCVIHRDLKLGNLFLDRNLKVKVGDLGLASRLSTAEEKRKTICGTPNYIAPEIIQGTKETRGHSFEVDIWSMGVILYTILVGKPPYEAKDVKATYKRIISNEYHFPSHVHVSDSAKDLITLMLQSNPSDRPNLHEIIEHPFSRIEMPESLPLSVLHHRPEWIIDEHGSFHVAGAAGAAGTYNTGPISISSYSKSNRICFSNSENNLDLNQKGELKGDQKGREIKESVRDRILSALAPSLSGRQQFEIFDENVKVKTKTHSKTGYPIVDEIVAKATALKISDFNSEAERDHLRKADERNVLEGMFETLTTVLDIAEKRKNSYDNCNGVSSVSECGSKIWVTRYVDYTSKYGLGFLLSDGSSGVYFNDSTKAVLEAQGDKFQYIERRKVETNNGFVKKNEPTCEPYSLTEYPESLQKKVTLLKHFRNYLIEQQKKSEFTDELSTHHVESSASSDAMTYLKKWVRTKHAILFRLSNETVQIVFYDQTEILLTSDYRYVTYVDKKRNRTTFLLNDELVGTYPEMAKRLKYSKEILNQLLNGQQQQR